MAAPGESGSSMLAQSGRFPSGIMAQVRDTANAIARPLIALIERELVGRAAPLVVALDGQSGAGKSTVAVTVAEAFGEDARGRPRVTVIEGDDFYSGGSSDTWDRRSPAEKVDLVIDWRRQREVLRSLLANGVAEYRPFDWESPDWDADELPLADGVIRCTATPVVLLEGAYSARPQLADMIDLRVLLDVPAEARRAQLLEREGEEFRAEWLERWSQAETCYFDEIMTPDRFDLVLRPR